MEVQDCPLNLHLVAFWILLWPVLYVVFHFACSVVLTDTQSQISSVLAFKMVCIVMSGWCAIWGVLSQNPSTEIGAEVAAVATSAHGRLYGCSWHVMHCILLPMAVHSFWECVACVAIKDFREPLMIMHHALIGTLGVFAFYPFALYYDSFFLGVCELSTFALGFMDTFKRVPALQHQYPKTNEVSRVVFALMFIAVRLIYWPFWSYSYWVDAVSFLLFSEPHQSGVLVFYLLSNVFMTGTLIPIAMYLDPYSNVP